MEIKNSRWITVSKDTGDLAPVFRKKFSAEKQIEKAEMEITALGVYEAVLNGKRVGDFVLAPGWTSYKTRLQVQTYDVTDLLQSKNDLRVTVDDLEKIIPDASWPLPKYREMLFVY